MVEILTAVLGGGLPAVKAACAEALREGVHSADVVLKILARQREPTAPVTILTPEPAAALRGGARALVRELQPQHQLNQLRAAQPLKIAAP